MTLQELFETAHTNARRMFLEEGEIVPTWHAVPGKGRTYCARLHGRRTDFRVFKKGGRVTLAPACHAERPLSSSFTCDTLDRASPDAERLGHLQDTNTLRKLLPHSPFGRAVNLRPTELHALCDGALFSVCPPLAGSCLPTPLV